MLSLTGDSLRKYIGSLYKLTYKKWLRAEKTKDAKFYKCLYTCFLEKRIKEKFEDLLKSIKNEWRFRVEDYSPAIRTARLQAEKIKLSFKEQTEKSIDDNSVQSLTKS